MINTYLHFSVWNIQILEDTSDCMTRISSDHDTIDSVRATVVSHGTRRKIAIELPSDVSIPAGEVFQISMSGNLYHGRFDSFADGLRLLGVYQTPDVARDPAEGDDHLSSWLTDEGLTAGRSVHVDIIEPEYKYGLRPPGEQVVYTDPDPPDSSLQSIAEQFSDNI